MKIRTQFIITMLVFGTLLTGIAASALITNQQVTKAIKQEETANSITQRAGELSFLSNDYLIYREAQQLQRWQTSFTAFAGDVAKLRASNPEQQALVNNIRANQQRLKEVLDSMVSSFPPESQGIPADPTQLQTSWSRMAVQIQALVSDASRLSRLLNTQVTQLRQSDAIVLLILIAAFVFYFAITYSLIHRRTFSEIERLKTGTSIIGNGDLSFRFAEKKNDEIGELSHAINQMTASLQTVTASKTVLETEIAERQKVETALRQSEAEVSSILASAPMLMLVVDSERQVLKANDAAREFGGRPLEEMIGLRGGEALRCLNSMDDPRGCGFSPACQTCQIRLTVLDTINTGNSHFQLEWHLPFLIEDKREERYFLFSTTPLVDKTRQQALLCIEDITNLKQAQEQVSRSAVRRQRLLDLSTQIVAEKSLEGILTRVADAVRAITDARIAISGHGYVNGRFTIGGVSRAGNYPDCPPGQEFRFERGGVYLELLRSHPSILLTSDQLQKHPSWRGLPSGHMPLKGLVGARLFDANGQANGLIMASDKVSGEFNEADEVLVQHIAKITSLALQHIESRQTAEMRAAELEVANKELEAFSYSVSHDLRAPLRHMDSFSQLVLEDYADKLDDQGKQYIQYVREASVLMARLIDDLLNLSRVTRTEMNYEYINLSQMARNIVAEMEKIEPQRQAQVTIAPNLTAHGDRNLLRLVLVNLLDNAWKFTGKVAPAIIEIGSSERNGKPAYYIRDNGVGFDMAYADKLFRPFQRLHKASEFKGTGIGLATVQRIVHRHGGEVWAESRVGKGTTIFFTLR